ncbi:hypothetical protein [Streptomyces niveus]|uniref:hypothetical protein n=1 Tax=Streptomyces niveus TaxID=193462 RepID=UPI003864E8FB
MTELTSAEAQETEATETYGTAELVGTELRVKPVNKWRPSYLRALRLADYDVWAAGVLHEEDAPKFIELDATLDEINEFVAEAMESAGEAPKASGARSTRSKSTRKR